MPVSSFSIFTAAWTGRSINVALVFGQLFSAGKGTVARVNGKTVTSLVERIVGMTLYPMENDTVAGIDLKKLLPQVYILDILESFALPGIQPMLVHSFYHITAVAVYMHEGIVPTYGRKSHNHSHKFHAVVGCVPEAAADFLLILATTQYNPKATGAGVAAACTISI